MSIKMWIFFKAHSDDLLKNHLTKHQQCEYIRALVKNIGEAWLIAESRFEIQSAFAAETRNWFEQKDGVKSK